MSSITPKFDDPNVQAIYETGQRRIDAMRAELPADGTIPIPFRCYGCDEKRYDFAFRTGDGLPMCQKCFGGCVSALMSDTTIGKANSKPPARSRPISPGRRRTRRRGTNCRLRAVPAGAAK